MGSSKSMFFLFILQVDLTLIQFKHFHDYVEPTRWLRLESYVAAMCKLQVVFDSDDDGNLFGFDGLSWC
jgi:hypothetical protein